MSKTVRQKYIAVFKENVPSCDICEGDEMQISRTILKKPVEYSNSFDDIIRRGTIFYFPEPNTQPVEIPVDVYEETTITQTTRKKL